MPGRKPRTSRFLVSIAVFLCIFCGLTLTRSSANPSPEDDGKMPDMFVAENMDEAFSSRDGVTDSGDFSDEASPAEPEPTHTPTPKPTKGPEKVSPEASKGVWTPSGSKWMFLVDGNPYTGWLFDKDGNRYFFNSEGIMQTGWLDNNGKRYYLNADGIMQTGDITVDKETYHLNTDGALKGYTTDPKKESSPKESSDKNSDTNKKASSDKEKNKKQKRKTVALTFDDGPGSFTSRLLDCLEKNNAKATFFLVGREVESFPDEVKRMEALGCEIGNHSYSHVDLTTLEDVSQISEEIGKTDQLLLDLVGHGATVLRPPYGSINDNVVSGTGTPMILWSIDTLDWETEDADQTVETVLSSVKDGDIILMHDIYSASVDAAERLIPALIKEGYDLVTIQDLAKAHGVQLKTGIAYGNISANQQ